jgi:hypothetical protein
MGRTGKHGTSTTPSITDSTNIRACRAFAPSRAAARRLRRACARCCSALQRRLGPRAGSRIRARRALAPWRLAALPPLVLAWSHYPGPRLSPGPSPLAPMTRTRRPGLGRVPTVSESAGSEVLLQPIPLTARKQQGPD